MKLRYRRKQFRLAWHVGVQHPVFLDFLFEYGMARIKHQGGMK